MILIDMSNIFYRCMFVLEKLHKDESVKFNTDYKQITKDELLPMMVKEVLSIEDKFKYDWGKVVICCDGKGNWRYDFFKEYKQKRTENKENDERDWEYLRGLFEEIKNDIKTNSKYIVIEVPRLEADDLIALTTKYSQEAIMIVSNDKDLNQLVDGQRIKQFSLMTNDYVDREHHLLNEAILTGDSGDGVPNIFSDDNHYIREDKVRAKPVTKGMKEYFSDKIVNEASLIVYINEINSKGKEELDLNKILHNYQRNRMMIDLKMIPTIYEKDYKNECIKAIELAKSNEDKHSAWIDSIINNNTDEDSDELTVEDLFDE